MAGGSPTEELFARLRAWRLARARRHRIPAFRILPDRTLHGLVEAWPRSEAELLAVPGIGARIVEKYGEELLELLGTVRRTGSKLMVGHVLRYAPFYVAIRQRVAAGEIGHIMALHTSERVSYHHMAAAFVRGRWRSREHSNPMLLAKCCHDLDLQAWMKSGVRPTQVASVGALTHFRAEMAPDGAGMRCLVDC